MRIEPQEIHSYQRIEFRYRYKIRKIFKFNSDTIQLEELISNETVYGNKFFKKIYFFVFYTARTDSDQDKKTIIYISVEKCMGKFFKYLAGITF